MSRLWPGSTPSTWKMLCGLAHAASIHAFEGVDQRAFRSQPVASNGLVAPIGCEALAVWIADEQRDDPRHGHRVELGDVRELVSLGRLLGLDSSMLAPSRRQGGA